MIEQEILAGRRECLFSTILEALNDAPDHYSSAFAVRVLGSSMLNNQGILSRIRPHDLEQIAYQGFPAVAFLGFCLGIESFYSKEAAEAFISGLKRLQLRSVSSQDRFATDDLALLGVAEGIVQLNARTQFDLTADQQWLLDLIDRLPLTKLWCGRMRALAGDLLDKRGRLRVNIEQNTDSLALELSLRSTWPEAFEDISVIDDNALKAVLKGLLAETPPQDDFERAIVWLRSLDVIVDHACKKLFPSISDTAQLLRNIQHSLKRWVWREKTRRKNTRPSRWLIDDEYDVQALLWAVLYPVYGSELVDEKYLDNWGNVQPRADLGILKLKLIIEVKIAREPSDFSEIEAQIGNDLGLYFKDLNQFNRMIVFIYDDCNEPQPERHGSIKDALMKRERIEEVIIIMRPSMIPNRNNRGD